MHSTLAAKAMRELNWKPGQSAELSLLGEGSSAGPICGIKLTRRGVECRARRATRAHSRVFWQTHAPGCGSERERRGRRAPGMGWANVAGHRRAELAEKRRSVSRRETQEARKENTGAAALPSPACYLCHSAHYKTTPQLATLDQNCPMRDEPEMRNCFQCEVSLNMSQAKKGILLVNDYSHEEFGTAELGRDAGIRPGQPEVNLVPRRSSSHLWFYRGSAEGPAVPALEPRSTRRGASVPDEGQRIEPGPDHAAHRRLD